MSIQHVVFNMSSSVRYDRMEGREYLVAPMVMITEGVHAGSNGPLYYPREELAKTPEVWNHKPVVVYHPTMNGYGVSACDPDVITNRKVGVIMNTKFDAETGKLRAEAWLEKSRIEEVDSRIAEALSTGEMMELSTGLFTDNELIDGEWHGEPYKYIARNYRPDHLALLPDKIGACSIEDGAGLLQLNQSQQDDLITKIQAAFGVSAAIKSVVTSQIMFTKNNSLYQVDIVSVDGELTVNEETCCEVTSQVSFETNSDKPHIIKGVLSMSKETFVDELVANESTTFVEDDRKTLLELNENFLEKLQPVDNEEAEEASEEEVAEAEEAEVAKTEEAEVAETEEAEEVAEEELSVVNTDGEITVEDYVANAPSEIKDMLEAGLESHKRDRQLLIDVVVGNAKNVFTDSQLNDKPISELKALAALATNDEVEVDNSKPTPNFAGAATPAPTRNGTGDDAPLLIPTINWNDK